MNNTPPIPPREGLNLNNVMPPVQHEVLKTPADVEQAQVVEQPEQTVPQPEVIEQKPVRDQVTEESGNHDTSQSTSGLIFEGVPISRQDPKDVVDRGSEVRLTSLGEAENLANTISQVQSDDTTVN